MDHSLSRSPHPYIANQNTFVTGLAEFEERLASSAVRASTSGEILGVVRIFAPERRVQPLDRSR